MISRELQGLKGVGRIDRFGGVDREIRISLDPDRLLALGITAADVNRQIRATNVDLAGGRGEIGGQEQAIRTLAGARTVAQLAQTKIILPAAAKSVLSELGRIEDSNSEPRTFGRLNAEPVVAFAIFRSKGSSELSVKEVVEKRLAQLRQTYPDVELRLIDDAVAYTYGNYTSALTTLIEGAVLAVIVVFLFLRNWRATLITAIALPLSAIPTFWVMDLLGFSLNLVSLLGITLVTGILVDDAIVEIENIVRHMRMGKSPYKAAMEAADEIGLAVIAITLTIVAIFAPVSFMSGVAGQYFKQFGLTVAASVLFSLLVARLITPMMAAYLMRPVKHEEAVDGFIMRGYTRFLSGNLARALPDLAGRPRRVRRLGLRHRDPADRVHSRRRYLAHRRGGRAAARLDPGRDARRHRQDGGGARSPCPRSPASSRSAAPRRPANAKCAAPPSMCAWCPRRSAP